MVTWVFLVDVKTRDGTLLQTAIRETKEEIGIDIVSEQCMGRLSDLKHPKLQVAAYVFKVESDLIFVLEESEVAEVYWLPLQAFVDSLSGNTNCNVQRTRIRGPRCEHW